MACAFCLCMASSSRKRNSLAFASAARSSHALGNLQKLFYPQALLTAKYGEIKLIHWLSVTLCLACQVEPCSSMTRSEGEATYALS